jgi:hypothetical protein
VISRLNNVLGLVTSLLIVYLSLYFVYRFTHTQTWVDDKPYVFFGSHASYLFFRPASHLDSALTGMRSHPGARPEPVSR